MGRFLPPPHFVGLLLKIISNFQEESLADAWGFLVIVHSVKKTTIACENHEQNDINFQNGTNLFW